jgi:hypothetical protein
VHLYEDWGQPEQAMAWKAKLGMLDLPADRPGVNGPGAVVVVLQTLGRMWADVPWGGARVNVGLRRQSSSVIKDVAFPSDCLTCAWSDDTEAS